MESNVKIGAVETPNKDTVIIAKNLVYPTMHKIFEQWEDRLIPVQVTRDERGKKKPYFEPWQKAQQYYDFNGDFDKKNSIALRTGAGIGVVDVDTKDLSKLDDTWRYWVEERLSKKDTLIVETYNGYHIYINLKDFKLKSTAKEGKDKSPMPFIDFRGEGGVVFIASTANKVSYEVLSSSKLMEPSTEVIEQLPEKQENVPSSEDDDFSTDDLYEKKSADEVRGYLKLIPNDGTEEDWKQLMASALNICKPNEIKDVKRVIHEWSRKDYKDYSENEVEKLFNRVETKEYGVNIGGSKLIRTALDCKVKKTIECINKSSTIEDIGSFLEYDTWLDFPVVYEKISIEKIVEAWQDKEKELAPKQKVSRSDTLTKKINESITDVNVERVISSMTERGMTIGFTGSEYIVCDNTKMIKSSMMSKGNTMDYIERLIGVDRKIVGDVLKNLAINISDVMYKTDYLQDIKARFIVEPHPTDILADKVLVIYSNPLFDIEKIDFDMEIVNDFKDIVWDGKLTDLLRLIALTTVFRDKKNIIGIVAPPNTAKSSVPMILGSPKTKMQPLVKAIDAEKGLGKGTIDQMKMTGLLLIDEVDKAIPDALKGFVDGLYLDQFGAGGGTQFVELKCTMMTSTHDTMFKNADAEIVERCLCIKIDEHKHSIKTSPIYLKNPAKYRKHTEAFIKWTFKQEFAREHSTSELIELQKKYKVELQNEDIFESAYDDVVRDLVESCLGSDKEFVINKAGFCCIKSKALIEASAMTALSHYPDLPNFDGKVKELVNSIINPKLKNEDRKTVKGSKYWTTKIKADALATSEDFDEI